MLSLGKKNISLYLGDKPISSLFLGDKNIFELKKIDGSVFTIHSSNLVNVSFLVSNIDILGGFTQKLDLDIKSLENYNVVSELQSTNMRYYYLTSDLNASSFTLNSIKIRNTNMYPHIKFVGLEYNKETPLTFSDDILGEENESNTFSVEFDDGPVDLTFTSTSLSEDEFYVENKNVYDFVSSYKPTLKIGTESEFWVYFSIQGNSLITGEAIQPRTKNGVYANIPYFTYKQFNISSTGDIQYQITTNNFNGGAFGEFTAVFKNCSNLFEGKNMPAISTTFLDKDEYGYSKNFAIKFNCPSNPNYSTEIPITLNKLSNYSNISYNGSNFGSPPAGAFYFGVDEIPVYAYIANTDYYYSGDSRIEIFTKNGSLRISSIISGYKDKAEHYDLGYEILYDGQDINYFSDANNWAISVNNSDFDGTHIDSVYTCQYGIFIAIVVQAYMG